MLLFRLVAFFLVSASAFAQASGFAFYDEFRAFAQRQRQKNASISSSEVLDVYRSQMLANGVSAEEIDRRINLVTTKRNELEDDFWNRFFTQGKSTYNTAPNAFLTEIAQGMKPGAALDYAMGEGRNSIYLAKLGWKVSGFDPAAAAVSLARKRATELGLHLDTATVRDAEYEFGSDRFDLILLSWAATTPQLVPKLLASLRSGGSIVIEAGADWFPRNGLLRLFDSIRVVRYEIVRGKSDFFNRADMEIVRLQAIKP